jgi:hypothetical protein
MFGWYVLDCSDGSIVMVLLSTSNHVSLSVSEMRSSWRKDVVMADMIVSVCRSDVVPILMML